MIKHNSAASVISPFNPIISLNSQMRKQVNEEFIMPIIKLFFSDKGGINKFSSLDVDKLKTEIEFSNLEQEFVKPYVYNELMSEIEKDENGDISFNPRYLISFDWDLTKYEEDENKYPYKSIFAKSNYKEEKVRYGVIRLGNAPILYIIYIELQEVIRFIKTLSYHKPKEEQPKIEISPERRRNELINQLVAKQERKLRTVREDEKDKERRELNRLLGLSQEALQGERGKLRVNLSWSTTDDLDLHIKNENGNIINYQNKIVEFNGSIGKLDVDANAGGNLVSNPQENISWDIIPEGIHTISVNLYTDREKKGKVPFSIFIDNGEDSRLYDSYVENDGINKTRNIASFQYINNNLSFEKLIT